MGSRWELLGVSKPSISHVLYGIFTYIYPMNIINDPNVGKYTIHGASG